MEKYVREEQIKGYVCRWINARGVHCEEVVGTLEAAYALYVSNAKYVDGSNFTCTKQTTIIFE